MYSLSAKLSTRPSATSMKWSLVSAVSFPPNEASLVRCTRQWGRRNLCSTFVIFAYGENPWPIRRT